MVTYPLITGTLMILITWIPLKIFSRSDEDRRDVHEFITQLFKFLFVYALLQEIAKLFIL